MVFYISTLCRDNVYRLSSEGGQGGKYRFMNISAWTGSVLNAAVHPDDSHAAYTDMLSPLVEWGNMQMLFTDFLCWRGPEVQRQLPEYFEADHTWLEGMVRPLSVFSSPSPRSAALLWLSGHRSQPCHKFQSLTAVSATEIFATTDNCGANSWARGAVLHGVRSSGA